MVNFKFIFLFLTILIFAIGGIYFGFLKFDNGKNLFGQISGINSGDDFKYVGEVELINDSVNQNVVVKPAKKNKKTATNLNENIVKVVSGVPATSTVAISTSTIVSLTPIILAQEQNQISATSTAVPVTPITNTPIASSTPVVPDVAPVVQSSAINHILVSEIMVGMEGKADYEFIELYNPTSQPVDLTGWSIKKKSSTASESTLVASSRLEGKIIPANKYYLFANEGGYGGQISPDVFWPKSYTLAYSNNSVIIYNANSELVEEISWTEIPKSQSIERESWNNNQFKIQPTPNPQNSQNN